MLALCVGLGSWWGQWDSPFPWSSLSLRQAHSGALEAGLSQSSCSSLGQLSAALYLWGVLGWRVSCPFVAVDDLCFVSVQDPDLSEFSGTDGFCFSSHRAVYLCLGLLLGGCPAPGTAADCLASSVQGLGYSQSVSCSSLWSRGVASTPPRGRASVIGP